jgi:hypothetical protein
VQVEKLGKPGIFFVASNFIKDAQSASSDWGMPPLRTLSIPSQEWYTYRRTLEELRPVAAKLINALVDGLTRPLTQAEAKPPQRKAEAFPPIKVAADSFEAANEKFNEVFLEKRMGDGLPLVPPTAERVKWMLSGTKRLPGEVLGKCPMKLGNVTVEKIAINAVMAGAKPEYLPAIISAMDCFVGESGPGQKGEYFFHTLGSSGAFNLVILLNGPLAKEINMNSGIGLFGHGWRANNTIGRSVRLSTITIGHCWPAENDMALTGRASAHTWFTFAENEAASPWEPYHVSKGFKPEDSVVTVTKVNNIFSTYGGGAVAFWTAQSILDQMAAKMNKGSGYWAVFDPEVADELKKLGFSRKDVQEWFGQKVGMPPEHINITVAGGVPGYTLLFGIMMINAHVSKKITGATLTKAGRV